MNISENDLNRLVDKLAGAMIKRIYGVEKDADRNNVTYYADRDEDHMVGELARLMTLLNLYEDREEYEKCHAVKKHLDRVNKILDNAER